ncbi:MAG: flagellar biosynthetic protein FliQ [Parvularcula sp.]
MESETLTILREALSLAASMASPMLIAALITGLAIGLLQALTSIQEMTLTFVPKLAIVMVTFWASAGVLMRLIVGFFDRHVVTLIAS